MKRNNKGFTALETVAAAIIVGIAAVMMYSLFIGVWLNFETELTRVDLAQQASRVFSVLEEDVMESSGLTLNGPNLTVDFPTAMLQDPLNPGTGLFFGVNRGNFPEQQVVYQVSVPTLVRLGQTTGRTDVLSNNVAGGTNFVLEGNPFAANGRRVTINLVLSDQVFGQPILYQQAKEITVRN